MKKAETDMEDELRPKYDLRSLRARRVGSERNSFGKPVVLLEPDVAEMFPGTTNSLNERYCCSNVKGL